MLRRFQVPLCPPYLGGQTLVYEEVGVSIELREGYYGMGYYEGDTVGVVGEREAWMKFERMLRGARMPTQLGGS